MLNTVYQLKRPRQFEVAFKEMEIDDRQVIVVRPDCLSAMRISVTIKVQGRKRFCVRNCLWH